ncbi:MAG TPA: DUF86 domain-containing protein [Syntrophorhabdaceae bacterium]|nr:DUF86 domain-containing protein [Syntrophorhabdaceae bacterium]
MKRKGSVYIRDIIESIEKIEDFIVNMGIDEMIQDDKTASAVVRKLEIIGEAAKQIPQEIRQRFQNIPWSSMAKTRDKIIHFYHGIDCEIRWQIIKEDLPPLKPLFLEIYNILKDEEK